MTRTGAPKPNQLLQNLGHVRREPKWSFNSRNNEVAHESTAGGMQVGGSRAAVGSGPNGYADTHRDTNGKYDRGPHFSFGGIMDENGRPLPGVRPKSAPGPGAYRSGDRTKPRNPSYSFGSTPRSAWANGAHCSPGPNAYPQKANTIVGGGLKYSMGGKPDTVGASKTPGPGAYKARPVDRGSHPWWGHGATRVRPTSAPPGPGAYRKKNLMGDNGPKWSHGIKREEALRPSAEIQGPFTHLGY